MPWKECSVVHERLRFVAQLLDGEAMSEVCRAFGIKEVDDGIWIVSFMHYDLGFIDLEQKTLQLLNNPFGTGLSPMS
jgi:hypothetical protein